MSSATIIPGTASFVAIVLVFNKSSPLCIRSVVYRIDTHIIVYTEKYKKTTNKPPFQLLGWLRDT